MAVGDTLPPDTLPASPLLHAYVDMLPLPAVAFAASIVLPPLQMIAGVAVGDIVGLTFTVTEVEAVALQPLASVTVTLYVPLIAVVEFAIVGFGVAFEYVFGPLHV